MNDSMSKLRELIVDEAGVLETAPRITSALRTQPELLSTWLRLVRCLSLAAEA
jgi:hypothetical protein